LFQGYEAASDEAFVEWVKRYHDSMDDGTVILTAEQLMILAARKYADRVNSGLWAKPNPQQESIIALTAQLKKMTGQQARHSKQDVRNKKPQFKNKGFKKGQVQQGPRKIDAWKLAAPMPGKPSQKTVNGKTYYFCRAHNDGKGVWVLHKPTECRMGKFQDRKNKPEDKKNVDTTKPVEKGVGFNAAYASLIDEDNDTDEVSLSNS
jgi:hypothetical protein